MIPKKIHFVWVGDQEKSALALKCIESWKKHLPDYEIIEWGNEKYDAIKNNFSEQAYRNKKWAFVSDYIRLYALYHEGGVYLDSDVEVVENMDSFLKHDFFTGYEDYHGQCSPITAVMAAKKHNPIIKRLLDYYDGAQFECEGGVNQTTNTAIISSQFSEYFGLSQPYLPLEKFNLDENSVVYPSYYFCTPLEGEVNYSIHHFNGSWVDGYRRKLKLSLGAKLSLVRFKRQPNTKSKVLPILHKEKVIFTVPISSKKIYALIWRT